MTRSIPFVGDDSAYIQFLERLVFELDKSRRYSSGYDETSQGIQEDLNNVCVYGETSQPHDSNAHPTQRHSHIQSSTDRAQSIFDAPNYQQYARAGDSPAFQFIEFDIKDLDSVGKQPQVLNQKKVNTLSNFSNFLQNLPQSEEWKAWHSAFSYEERKNLLRTLAKSHRQVASSLTFQEAPELWVDPSPESADLSILSEYAEYIISCGKMNQQIAYFREIVFVSACAIELEMVKNKDCVFEVMRKALGSKVASKQLLKLARGAKWVNNFISCVSKTKWASRSWDILCVGMSAMIEVMLTS
jgi:hypothetical protein